MTLDNEFDRDNELMRVTINGVIPFGIFKEREFEVASGENYLTSYRTAAIFETAKLFSYFGIAYDAIDKIKDLF